MVEAGVQQREQVSGIGGRHHQQVRNAAAVTDIEVTGMSGAIRTDDASAIDGEQHIQVLNGDIMDQLIVSAL